MVFIPGGTFVMGSERHYREEARAHRVIFSPFRIDKTPVTNREFRKFVNAAGHVMLAELPPDPKDYPSALPHVPRPASLVFTPSTNHVGFRCVVREKRTA
ncbi:formylglycine-generating enzyme family protein [Reyranella sp.]|uniref:formylglycine-generating enzyme family protein n=1 Tax=Reyranella sp. TaxID=1929291 RepID=UPI003D095E49